MVTEFSSVVGRELVQVSDPDKLMESFPKHTQSLIFFLQQFTYEISQWDPVTPALRSRRASNIILDYRPSSKPAGIPKTLSKTKQTTIVTKVIQRFFQESLCCVLETTLHSLPWCQIDLLEGPLVVQIYFLS